MVVGYQDGLCWVGISSEMEYSGKGSSNQTAKCHRGLFILFERQKKQTENLTLGLHHAGPVETALRVFGPVKGLAAGPSGEVSPHFL